MKSGITVIENESEELTSTEWGWYINIKNYPSYQGKPFVYL